MAKAAAAANALKEGSVAPDFSAKTASGEEFRLSAHRGRKIVLYFYPKADTPGCTKEACGFRDTIDDLAALNATVVGVSPDPEKALAKFRDKYQLPFTLLADTEHTVSEAYGAWQEKSMYGKTYMGVARSTFVIDEDGKILKVFPKVKPQGHAEEVKAVLEA